MKRLFTGKLVATTNIKNNHALPTLLATKENINEQNIFFTIVHETKNAISFASPISLSRTCSKDDTKNISSINLNSRILIGWSQIEISKRLKYTEDSLEKEIEVVRKQLYSLIKTLKNKL